MALLDSIQETDLLLNSLASIRREARYTKDICQWLKQHIHIILGDAQASILKDVDITVSRTSLDLLSFQKHPVMEMTFTITGNIPLATHPVFFEGRSVEPGLIAFSHEWDLDLHIAHWPLVAAIAAGKYLQNVGDLIRPAFKPMEEIMERYLPVHFPDYTFARLRQLAQVDLLKVTGSEETTMNDVIDFLFMTIDTPQKSLDLPEDIS